MALSSTPNFKNYNPGKAVEQFFELELALESRWFRVIAFITLPSDDFRSCFMYLFSFCEFCQGKSSNRSIPEALLLLEFGHCLAARALQSEGWRREMDIFRRNE